MQQHVLHKIVKEMFPWIERSIRCSDGAPNCKCALGTLGDRAMEDWTGIRCVMHGRGEPGEGKGIVDMKCSHCKGYLLRNVTNGVADVLSAERLVASLNKGGGIKGCMNVVIKSESIATAAAAAWLVPQRERP